MPADPAWRTRADAARAAAGFGRLVERHAGRVPAEALAPYRAACAASPEAARFEFLVAVAGHLALRLDGGGPEPVPRAAALLIDWFLRAR